MRIGRDQLIPNVDGRIGYGSKRIELSIINNWSRCQELRKKVHAALVSVPGCNDLINNRRPDGVPFEKIHTHAWLASM